ncbi:MAG: hypothetical protein HYZ31_01225, partial [Gammaproteobacteria bacterium]|nr:hypothetical protein [Gammaproteobacteria bacterium]
MLNNIASSILIIGSSTLLQTAAAETTSPDTATLEEITVTGTREGQALNETPASVSIIDEASITATNPT